MRWTAARTLLTALPLLAVLVGCTSKVTGGRSGDALNGDQDPVTTCIQLGGSCSGGKLCCVGICTVAGTCELNGPACAASGTACNDNLDCCTLRCEGGFCSASLCLDNGEGCTAAESCCTATCTANACGPIGDTTSSCKVIGQACAAPAECCSTNCQNDVCAVQFTCRATDDLCFSDLDCCTNLCSKNDGTAGACVLPPGGCSQGGMPCTSGTNCCTRICSDPGTGVRVCLPASGCRMSGLSCVDAQSCCGGGTNPNGTVECAKLAVEDAFGRCDNGQSCNPVGNICGATFILPDGSTFTVNASQNCCDGRKEVCKLDAAGIPRCFGGGSAACPNGYTGEPPCCIDEGELCQFRDQCCSGMACLPDSAGVLRCGGSSCIPLGSVCDPSGGEPCCAGECLANGDTFICQPPATQCEPNGESCIVAADCCSGICVGGVCGADTCQGSGDVCTSDGDCCTGLSCIIPSGSLSGTCGQGGSSCALLGQSCSTANPCCSGSICVISNSLLLCDDSAACTCWMEDPV